MGWVGSTRLISTDIESITPIPVDIVTFIFAGKGDTGTNDNSYCT